MLTYNIEPHVSGDTWKGIGTITFLRNNSAMNLSGALLEMDVRLSIDSPVAVNFTTENDTILIINPLSGVVKIPPQIVDIPVGSYVYDLKLTLPDGEVKTYLKGQWPILSHVTR